VAQCPFICSYKRTSSRGLTNFLNRCVATEWDCTRIGAVIIIETTKMSVNIYEGRFLCSATCIEKEPGDTGSVEGTRRLRWASRRRARRQIRILQE